MQKVPSGVQETQGDVEGPIEDSIVELISGSKEEIQKNEKLTAHQSKKKLLAKGLLLLGGAIFITKGYSSLGAKLAVACVINKLVKKHGVSKNIFSKAAVVEATCRRQVMLMHWSTSYGCLVSCLSNNAGLKFQ